MMAKKIARALLPGLAVLFLLVLADQNCLAQRGRGRNKGHESRAKEIKKKLSSALPKKDYKEFYKKLTSGEYTEKELDKILSQKNMKKVLTKAEANFLKEELKYAHLRKKRRDEGKEPPPGKAIREKLLKLLTKDEKKTFWKKFRNGELTERELEGFLSEKRFKDKLSKADINKIKELRKEYERKAENKKKKKDKGK